MSKALATTDKAASFELALMTGDLAKLTTEERLSYYNAVCSSTGLNQLTRPFEYITLNGKLTLYARRDCTDQLRKIHTVSIKLVEKKTIDGVYVITASATDKAGRVDESTGAVTIQGLKGDALANALMKAETKAKRRVTLSICGLGLLDETEVETINHAAAPIVKQPAKKQSKQEPIADRGDACEPGIGPDTINELVNLMDILGVTWGNGAIERAGKIIGRNLGQSATLQDLTEEEAKKLVAAMKEAVEKMAATA